MELGRGRAISPESVLASCDEVVKDFPDLTQLSTPVAFVQAAGKEQNLKKFQDLIACMDSVQVLASKDGGPRGDLVKELHEKLFSVADNMVDASVQAMCSCFDGSESANANEGMLAVLEDAASSPFTAVVTLARCCKALRLRLT